MKTCATAILLALTATQAQARCAPSETEVFSCKIAGSSKRVEICEGGQVARYSFGKAGQSPELDLSAPIAALDYVPWNGIGRTIYEQVTFQNKGYGYTVYFLFDRLSEVPTQAVSGGISVEQNAQEIANLECNPDTISSGMEIFVERKRAVGLCWDYKSFAWTPNCPTN